MKNNIFNRVKPYLIMIVFSLIFIFPFLFSKGSLYGDDLHFHLDRMLGLSNIFDSPINFKTFYNSGQGINFFYPFLIYYPFYIIFSFVHSIWVAWYFYLFIITFITLSISFYSATSISKSKIVGYLFAIIYTFSTYRSYNILIRFATGEILAMAFLPLIFAGAYQVFKGDYRKWPMLSIGMTLLVYSHLLSVFIATLLLTIYLLIFLVCADERKKRIMALINAVLSCTLMSLFQIVPLIEQILFTKLSSPVTFPLNNQLFNFKQLIMVNLVNQLDKQVGFVLFISVVVICLRLRYIEKIWRILFVMSLCLLLATSCLVNWEKFPLDLLKVIQFPWRLNGFTTIFLSYLLAIVLFKLKKYIYVSFIILAISMNTVSVMKTCKLLAEEPVKVTFRELSKRNDYYKLTHSVFVPDYTNEISKGTKTNIMPDDPRWRVVQHEVYLDKQLVNSEQSSYSASDATFQFTNSHNKSEIAYLPVYFYKGQKVYLDGKKVFSSLSEWSSTAVAVPPGTHILKVTYSYTLLDKLSFTISLFSTFIFLLIYIRTKTENNYYINE